MKPTSQAHRSSTCLLPHEWQGLVRNQTPISLAVLNQHNMAWTKTHSKFSIQRSEFRSFSIPTGNMETVKGQPLPRPGVMSDHHWTHWYRSVQWENSKQLLHFQHYDLNILCAHKDRERFPSCFLNGHFFPMDTFSKPTRRSLLGQVYIPHHRHQSPGIRTRLLHVYHKIHTRWSRCIAFLV